MPEKYRRRSIWHPTHVAQLFLGPVLWALWFVALYGGLSVACALAPPPAAQGAMNWLNASLLASTFGVAALLLVWARRCWHAGFHHTRGLERFFAQAGAGIHLFSAGATLVIGLPVLALPPCL